MPFYIIGRPPCLNNPIPNQFRPLSRHKITRTIFTVVLAKQECLLPTELRILFGTRDNRKVEVKQKYPEVK